MNIIELVAMNSLHGENLLTKKQVFLSVIDIVLITV